MKQGPLPRPVLDAINSASESVRPHWPRLCKWPTETGPERKPEGSPLHSTGAGGSPISRPGRVGPQAAGLSCATAPWGVVSTLPAPQPHGLALPGVETLVNLAFQAVPVSPRGQPWTNTVSASWFSESSLPANPHITVFPAFSSTSSASMRGTWNEMCPGANNRMPKRARRPAPSNTRS